MIVPQWTCKRCGFINPATTSKCIACEKLRPKQKKPSADLLTDYHQCVIIALDTAKHCGWAIRDCGKLIGYGEYNLFTKRGVDETQRVIISAMKLAWGENDIPLRVVSERPWGGHMGLGDTKAFGYWLHALLEKGIMLSAVIQVYPSQWRSKILPSGSANLERDEVREIERTLAIEMTGDVNIGLDASPAVLISEWAARSVEIANTLPRE